MTEHDQAEGGSPNAPMIGRDFADVDSTGAADSFIRHLDSARRQGLLAEGKRWSFEHLALSRGEAVLDIGCGTGDDVAAMAELVGPEGRAVGVDYSEAMVAEALRRHGDVPGISFRRGDAQALPFDSEVFDACRAERVLIHVQDPDAAVREMARVVRPGGRVALIEPDWEAFLVEGPDPGLSAKIWRSTLDDTGRSRVGRRLRTLLLDAGFDQVTIHAAAGVITDLDVALERFQLDKVAEDSVARGAVSAAEAHGWLAALRAAQDSGRFLCVVLNFRAAAHR